MVSIFFLFTWTIFPKSHTCPLVLAQPGAINIFLIDVPPADDYYLLLINSTIGLMVATSCQFSILAASSTPSPSPPSPVGSVPTVTVSGAPNLTAAIFATTFATLPGGAVPSLSTTQVYGLLITLLGCALGATLTLGWWSMHTSSTSLVINFLPTIYPPQLHRS